MSIEWVSVESVIEHLDISRRTLDKYLDPLRTKIPIPSHQIAGGRRWFILAEVDVWLLAGQERSRESQGEAPRHGAGKGKLGLDLNKYQMLDAL